MNNPTPTGKNDEIACTISKKFEDDSINFIYPGEITYLTNLIKEALDAKDTIIEEQRKEIERYEKMFEVDLTLWAQNKIKQLEVKVGVAEKALDDLVKRIDFNGGLGEYKGGPSFVMSYAREALKTIRGDK